MSKINQIQNAIRELDGGAYQKLMDMYLYKKFGFRNITPLGSHTGTNKTTKGTPDSYVLSDSGKYILIAYGTVSEEPYTKIEKDILSCLDKGKTGIDLEDVEQIICCHTSTNISIDQHKVLCTHFQNTMLIGLGELSTDLCLKYPVIAKDHLSVVIDTHQIFDLGDFVEYASNNVYSTPLDMPLLCREKETEELLTLLNEKQIVMICGKSGVGKTRLALEIATQFGNSNNYTIRIIKSNNESIYDDLQATITDDEDFLVVVDDADQLVQLTHILEMCISTKRIHCIKVLLTVRDYAKESLIQKVKSVLQPALFSLKPLEDDNIKNVLNDNLGIKNQDYIKQILKISKGNIRLAIMAGKCAIEESFDSIKNAFDIFDYYFSNIVTIMDKNEILTATLSALFDSLILKREEKPIELAEECGISYEEFVDICETLHQKEVVSIFNNLAVKFEDQNLRDYLLFYVFFKKKWITPSFIILNAFPSYRERIVYAFNTLVNIFNTEENLTYIENEVKKAWVQIKMQPNGTVFQFVEVFHAVIPDETLFIIKQEIDQLPVVHTDFRKYDFEKTSNNHRINSEVINLLIGFKYSNRFLEAIKLAFYYLERNTENPMDFYFLFRDEWGFDYESYKYGFTQECLLLKQLIEYYEIKSTPEAALCLIFCIENCLKYEFSTTESNPNNTFTLHQFGLSNCKEIFEIRSLCFKTLAFIFSNTKYRKFAIKALLGYSGYLKSDDDKEKLLNDMVAFSDNFLELIDISNFEHCAILYHFHTICERHDVACPQMLFKYRDNSTYMLYLSIKKDSSLLYPARENAECERKQKIYDLCHKLTDEEFDDLWSALEHYKIDSRANWDVSNGIGLLFESLAEDGNRFINILNSYIYHDTPFGNQFGVILCKLIEFLGYDEAITYVSSNEFRDKRKWIAYMHDNIPEENIDEQVIRFFIERLSEQKGMDAIYTLSLSTVLKIDAHYPDFLINYVEIMNAVCEKQFYVASLFWSYVGVRDNLQSDDIVIRFKDRVNILENSYLNALRGRQYFDYMGQLLIQIIHKDISFLSIIVKSILNDRYFTADNVNLEILWDQDNYYDLITIAIDTIKEEPGVSCYFDSLGERLLAYEQDKKEQWIKKDKWIEDYITNNCGDIQNIKFIFEIVCNFPEERRQSIILLFCQRNPNFSDFKKISLTPSYMEWSGSEVPLLEKRITFLGELKNELKGFDYIEHRNYLDEQIQYIRERIERVLLVEFIEVI